MRQHINWPGALAFAALMTIAAAPRQAGAMTASPVAVAGMTKDRGAGAIIPVRDVIGHGFQPYGAGAGAGGGATPSYDGRRDRDEDRGYGPRRRVRPYYDDQPSYYDGPRYYDQPNYDGGPRYYSHPRRCRDVWTDYGPRRICR